MILGYPSKFKALGAYHMERNVIEKSIYVTFDESVSQPPNNSEVVEINLFELSQTDQDHGPSSKK